MNTVAKEIRISGVGIHSGKPANMLVKPSEKPGIFFVRTDSKKKKLIPAAYGNVSDTALRNTTVGKYPDCVQTIEHLMAALFVSGVDAAVIEIDGPEIPILDGSAKEFCKIFSGKIKKIKGPAKTIIIKKEIVARQSEIVKKLPLTARAKLWLYNLLTGRKSDGFVRLYPYKNGLSADATLVYREPVIGAQSREFLFDYTDAARKRFAAEIAAARTFGKFSEWEYLKARGMARGASERNVIALNDAGDGTLNPLYWPDEFVRHKITDILGDMFTSGGRVIGGVESYKGSHALNNLALRKMFADPENYEIINL